MSLPARTRFLALAAALVLAACGGDDPPAGGGGDAPTTPAEGSCPEGVDLTATASDGEEVTLTDPVTAFALLNEDDTLYGDHFEVVLADFEIEPGATITTESGGKAVEIGVYNRDQTLPAEGTFDFEGDQNTYFQPTFYAGGTARPVTTIGEGGTLTLSTVSDEQVCGGIDVTDGAVTIRGSFAVPVENEA